MLNSRMRKAAAAASPVKASGVAETSVWPSAPFATNAASSEPAGTATISQRGWRSLRSIRTRVLSPGHLQADLLDARVGARRLADDLPLVHDGDPVGEREDLVEVLADQQDGDALAGGVAEVLVHGLDRADVEAARRRRRHEELRQDRELAREHNLLEVAAREESR